ncbi:hypothetical protein CAPTEDRAFT_210726 [Capitella teleta]|uniref:Uncharacterized protein n=1 Tax=Capitella teleta TaxID=283909 RepID=R7TMI3_CAPTE|nr:hypothetical protein CAPTEDRAFT_210726 [Capitella teleta]|eukprot:ELT94829.1 hypothetical protein CAPTEDRAFT_210726 [Capitella teleta]
MTNQARLLNGGREKQIRKRFVREKQEEAWWRRWEEEFYFELGLKSDWWRAVNRMAMEYNLDGGKGLDAWIKEMAKEEVERTVKQRQRALEKWRGRLSKDKERWRSGEDG